LAGLSAFSGLSALSGLEILARVRRERGAARFFGVLAESVPVSDFELSSDEGGGTSIK